ncbi:hypothetical protein RhiirC2_777472 [Rhizophagus irregularis]|uniref:Uncharacterized protein n=1 Tax=Rhizophagus irregularis TaxID=588596 RepID=A0A2N1NEA1_9GLOM|nr:hypothetical protein RhiirC2_777472 [Rhizophagus irregularis]
MENNQRSIELLSPFENAIYFLSDVKYPIIGFIYPCIYNLREKLENDFALLETVDNCQNQITVFKNLCRNNGHPMLESAFTYNKQLSTSKWDLTLADLKNWKRVIFATAGQFWFNCVYLGSYGLDNGCHPFSISLGHFWKERSGCSSAVIFDRNIDELTTAMGNFWKKKNAKITVPIKDEFQHYLNVSELPALE